jgi:hypothetical protein
VSGALTANARASTAPATENKDPFCIEYSFTVRTKERVCPAHG